MKKLDLDNLGKGGNLKRCIKNFNATHGKKFKYYFNKAYIRGDIALSDYGIIYKYQSGQKKPSLEALVAIATLLEVKPEELLS